MSDVRMIQGREDFGLALESRQPLVIAGDVGRQDFDRDVALQLRIARSIDFAHSAGAEGRDYFVGTEPVSGGERHLLGGGSIDGTILSPHGTDYQAAVCGND